MFLIEANVLFIYIDIDSYCIKPTGGIHTVLASTSAFQFCYPSPVSSYYCVLMGKSKCSDTHRLVLHQPGFSQAKIPKWRFQPGLFKLFTRPKETDNTEDRTHGGHLRKRMKAASCFYPSESASVQNGQKFENKVRPSVV